MADEPLTLLKPTTSLHIFMENLPSALVENGSGIGTYCVSNVGKVSD